MLKPLYFLKEIKTFVEENSHMFMNITAHHPFMPKLDSNKQNFKIFLYMLRSYYHERILEEKLSTAGMTVLRI